MKISEDDLPYIAVLHSVDGIGSARLQLLLEIFGSGKGAWEARGEELRRLRIPDRVISAVKQAKIKVVPEKYYERLLHSHIRMLTLCDDEYPSQLKEITTPPFILYYKGHYPTSPDWSIGVVGTRKVTGYGRTVTEALTGQLVHAGFIIVSGLARGVDTIAHKSSINAGGKTVAVLGGGLNKIYPPENTELASQIESGFGCIISEFPPDYPHLAGNFPSRNRIIAGLSNAVLVTEAAEDSGSLITARFAAEQNKDVFAIPGPITSHLAQGPLSLIKDGAKLVASVDDILNELGIFKSNQSPQAVNKLIEGLDPISKLVLEAITNESKHLDEISRELKFPSAQVSAILIKLEIIGLVKNLGSGIYTKL
jgi:DNA processing protein